MGSLKTDGIVYHSVHRQKSFTIFMSGLRLTAVFWFWLSEHFRTAQDSERYFKFLNRNINNQNIHCGCSRPSADTSSVLRLQSVVYLSTKTSTYNVNDSSSRLCKLSRKLNLFLCFLGAICENNCGNMECIYLRWRVYRKETALVLTFLRERILNKAGIKEER